MSKQLTKGTIVEIQTDAVYQAKQQSLNGMHGSVHHVENENEIIVEVAELGGVLLPFSEGELLVKSKCL